MQNSKLIGVQEMNTKEMKSVDGGALALIALAVGVYLGLALYAHENHH